MNKITKYITTGAAALLMLMSVGTAQNNVNASRRHYRVHVMEKYTKKNYRSRRNSRQNRKLSQRDANKVRKSSKRNTRKRRNHKNAKRSMKRSRRNIRRHVHQLKHRRYHSQQVLKPRYQIAKGNRRGNQALQKSDFYDGRGLVAAGYSQDYANYVFSKYAPNDKRAVIPNYMNPKGRRFAKKYHVTNYHNINDYKWVQGYFSLNNPQKDTKNPKVYQYYPKLRGWKLAPRY